MPALSCHAPAITRAFQLLLNRNPANGELDACRDVPLNLLCRTLINSNEFAFLP